MNWLQFLLWIAGFYTMYYLVVILLDLKGPVKTGDADETAQLLTFSEAETTQVMELEAIPKSDITTAKNHLAQKLSKAATPDIIASGGVRVKEIFNLARAEAIVYSKAITTF
ncbi:hypothetical protein [Mucilaginibacter sp. UYCu711]|uniref:hypothetical protein n=1 Tax=Mucilaginibacter sp. UYCu711 TaxID=3156339 RepID=UPI003D22D679